MPVAKPRACNARLTRKRRSPARAARRCSNLDFGRSWRRTLAQAGHISVIARKKDARQSKRYDEPCSLHGIAEELRRAHRHEEAIPAAVGYGRFLRAARHIFRHRHRRLIDHWLIGGRSRLSCGGHGHCGPCNRRDSKADGCQDGQETAYGGQSLHRGKIAQWTAS